MVCASSCYFDSYSNSEEHRWTYEASGFIMLPKVDFGSIYSHKCSKVWFALPLAIENIFPYLFTVSRSDVHGNSCSLGQSVFFFFARTAKFHSLISFKIGEVGRLGFPCKLYRNNSWESLVGSLLQRHARAKSKYGKINVK